MPIGNGAVMIGMGERTAPQAVTMIARELFRAGSARLVLAVMLPRSRHYMHLDTVMTMVDRDAVTLFPEVVDGARVWSIRPGETTRSTGRRAVRGGVIDALEQALGIDKIRVIPTGGDPFGSSASSGTTATTCSASSRASSSPMTAMSTPIRGCARRV